MPSPGQELSTLDVGSIVGSAVAAITAAQAHSAMTTVNFIKEAGFKRIADDQDPEKAETGDPIYVTFKYPKELAPYQPPVPSSLALAINASGAGYPSPPAPPPVVTISPPPAGGTQAKASVTVDNTGKVATVTLDDRGSGYTAAPTATIAAPPAGGTQATLNVSFTSAVPAVPAVYQTMAIELPYLALVTVPEFFIDKATIDLNVKIESMEYRKIDTSLKVDASLELRYNFPRGGVKLNASLAYQRNTQEGNSVARTYSLAIHVEAKQQAEPAPGLLKILDILAANTRSQPA